MNIADFLLKYRQPLWAPAGEGEGGTPPTGSEGNGGTPPAGDGDGKGEAAPASLLGGAGDDTPDGGKEDDAGGKEGDPTSGESEGDDGQGGEGEDDDTPAEPLTVEALTLPDGVEVNEEVMGEFLGILNDESLDRAGLAQKLVDLQMASAAKDVEAATEAAKQAWAEQQVAWQAEVRALPELGGEKLDATLAGIKKGLQAAGVDVEFFAAMDGTGAGNHPAVVKALHTLTKPFREGGPLGGQPSREKLSQADKMYGKN